MVEVAVVEATEAAEAAVVIVKLYKKKLISQALNVKQLLYY